MHSAAHAIFDTAHYLWVACAVLAPVALYLSWTGNGRWAKRLLILAAVVALVLATAVFWFPEGSHDINYDLFGALLWSSVSIGILVVTGLLSLIAASVHGRRTRDI